MFNDSYKIDEIDEMVLQEASDPKSFVSPWSLPNSIDTHSSGIISVWFDGHFNNTKQSFLNSEYGLKLWKAIQERIKL